MDALPVYLLITILLIAVVTDLRSMRIPNWLTFPAIAAGLAYHGITQGLDGLLFSLAGLGLGFAMMLLPFILKVMGAGDVKLMTAVGAFLGLKGVFSAFIWTSLAGGVYALVVLLFHIPQLKAIGSSIKTSFTTMMVSGEMSYHAATEGQKLPRLCYGLAIAAGTIVSMYFSGKLAIAFPGVIPAP
ncbi:A24 family peptidase [Oleidesulfovibrio sp.]|uniref:A24 family peptidase n=1 Tax=Oleidesulfovibrio sp. TaxID=2909707 RepID=UPI003A886BA7